MTTQTVNVNLKISDFLEVNNLLAELPEIVRQLESCGYECQAGKLEMNTAFIRMKEVLAELESGLTPHVLDGDYCTCKFSDFVEIVSGEICQFCNRPRQ